MEMYLITISFLIIFALLSENKAGTDTVLNETRYGEDWIYMSDGENNPQVALLKGDDIETRSWFAELPPEFWLYTKTHIDDGIRLYPDDPKSILDSDFRPDKPTIIIIHGWKSSMRSSGPWNLKRAYLEALDCYIIMVNWASLAEHTNYFISLRNTEIVGAATADMSLSLVKNAGANLSNIHVIGHSLGAHVAGHIGKNLKNMHPQTKIGRISGLDPALPGFQGPLGNKHHLTKDDAAFVDVIHSCGGILGFYDSLGHIDFYPNGGTAVQPGCCCLREVIDSCSHGRSFIYFAESVGSKTGFLASKCSSWDDYLAEKCINATTVYMGAYTPHDARGNYYLKTKSSSPFAAYIWESKNSDNNDCTEPGGWQVGHNNERICGSNSI